MSKYRITILDSFRAIAILSVMLFHFFSRWTPPLYPTSLYPYKDHYNYFSYGNLGVQFFFIISGFVIFFTLENTNSIVDFGRNRIVRLLPSMVVASIVTFVVLSLFDNRVLFPQSHKAENFIASTSFISPVLINKLFGSNLDYLNGSYWSLWPEIQFYFFVSLLYYFNKSKFVRNFILISLTLIIANHLFYRLQYTNISGFYIPIIIQVYYNSLFGQIFTLINYLPFFSIGVLFYCLFKSRQHGQQVSAFITLSLIFLMAFSIYVEGKLGIRLVYISMFLLFFLFTYFPEKLKFLENTTITQIGVSSYFLYLIHENIGVFLINKFGSAFLPYGFVFSTGLICLFVVVSIYYSRYVERPLGRWLKNLSIRSAHRPLS